MGRKRKGFKRKSGFRDARLFVIATEGQKTELKYFSDLNAEEYFPNNNVKVEVIPSEAGRSAPRHVLQRLDDFRRKYKINEDDELWMVIDRDFHSWTIKELSESRQLCIQKNYKLGISNPCFELWLLLHLEDVNLLSDKEKDKLKWNKRRGKRTHCEHLLCAHLGNYSKSHPDFSQLLPQVNTAIERADRLTNNGKVDLFESIGTNLQELVRKLLQER